MAAFIDLTGQRFGRWLVLHRCETNVRGKPAWECQCDCGSVYTVSGSDLRCGVSKQCVKCRPRRHGHIVDGISSPDYRSYMSMKARCTNPNAEGYENYGGRGISVCKRWRRSFQHFLDDMGPRPSLQHSLDRIDNEGNYTPRNCHWATAKQQGRNRRNNRMITHNGQTFCVSDWCEELGLSEDVVRGRLSLGWSMAEIESTPVLHTRKRVNGRFVSRV